MTNDVAVFCSGIRLDDVLGQPGLFEQTTESRLAGKKGVGSRFDKPFTRALRSHRSPCTIRQLKNSDSVAELIESMRGDQSRDAGAQYSDRFRGQ